MSLAFTINEQFRVDLSQDDIGLFMRIPPSGNKLFSINHTIITQTCLSLLEKKKGFCF